MEKKFIVYKTTNLLNGWFYIGCHVTVNVNDSYLGSGYFLKRAIKKHGKENFQKEILCECKSKEEMFAFENWLVDEEFVKLPNVYNLVVGGKGGFKEEERLLGSRMGEVARRNLAQSDTEWKRKEIDNAHKASLASLEARKVRNWNKGVAFFKGKSHTEESKAKIGQANSEAQKGINNSQFGTCWIRNEELKQNKKITVDELSSWESQGWVKGRKLRW